MNPPVWRVEDDGEAQLPVSPTAEAGLVSLPFLVAAVRRRWRRVAATAGVCAFLALGLTQAVGGQHAATITLLLINSPAADPNAAMTTNLSLLHTRKVSGDVVEKLHLPLTPEGFGATVTAGPLSDQLMEVTVTAPSDQEAVSRVNALASVYLDFRGQALSAFADSTIQANQQRIDSLNSQIAHADETLRRGGLDARPGADGAGLADPASAAAGRGRHRASRRTPRPASRARRSSMPATSSTPRPSSTSPG